jgi:hypothetical protein
MIGRRALLSGVLATAVGRPALADAAREAALRARILRAFGPALPFSSDGDDAFARHDQKFRTFADRHWAQDGARWEAANYYDRARIYYVAWARSGAPAWLQRAHALAVDYRDKYLIANRNQPSAHWAQMAGLLMHHWATGDEKSRDSVLRVAETFSTPYYLSNLADTGAEMDNRMQARVLTSLLYATQVGRPADAPPTGRLRNALDAILRSQSKDGAFRFARAQCGGVKPFMTGMLVDALIEYHDQFEADPRIAPAIQRAVDYLWTKTWDEASQSFWYLERDCQDEKREPAPDLNLMIVNGFGFTYTRTGEAVWRERGDRIFAAGVDKSWLQASKAFNQNYATAYRYPAYRTARA